MPVIFPLVPATFPRLPAAALPTPLQSLNALRAALGPSCPRLLVKRDDLTGLALGGNKARKLEFLLGDARQQGANLLLTCGAGHSNHALQTAAAARKFGFATRCILDSPQTTADAPPTGNLRLHSLLATPIVWATLEPGETRREQARRRVMAAEAERARQEGQTPYAIPTGGSTAIGALGYVTAMEELSWQCDAQRLGPLDAIYFASGSGGTQAGMAVGARMTDEPARLVGVEVDPIPPGQDGVSPFARAVLNLTNETAKLLGLPADFTHSDLAFDSDFTGPAYGVSTPEGEAAIRLLAQTEGIFLDPVYSGKAFAAFLAALRAGRFRPDATVLFWHTGGVAGLFASPIPIK